MRHIFSTISILLLTACAVVPKSVSVGTYESEAGFAVELSSPWSQWPSQINYITVGEYLTKDGPLLNRLHFISLKDGGRLVKSRRDADIPQYSANASELEVVDFVNSSLRMIGYTNMEAKDIGPIDVDGVEGLKFGLAGKWKNGLNVSGMATAVRYKGELKLVLFLAPEQHYFEASRAEVQSIIGSIDFAD